MPQNVTRIVKYITLEIRPMIQACQVYIVLNDNFHAEDITICIKSNSLNFITSCDNGVEQIIQLHGYQLKSDTISGYSFKNTDICFRVGIELNDLFSSLTVEDFTKMLELDNIPLHTVILAQKPITIVCKVCNNNFLKTDFTFERVLPLPSEGFDPSDVFCHASTSSMSLNLRKNDLLYSHCFFLISTQVQNIPVGVFRCDQCQSWLGMKQPSSLKLWNSTTRIMKHGQNMRELGSPLYDFIISMKNALSSSLMSRRKLIFKCQLDFNQWQYLMIFILDANLEMHSSGRMDWTILEEGKFYKVLFHFEEDTTANYWKDEEAVVEIDISQVMFESAKTALVQSHSMLPSSYSVIDGLSVAYLKRNLEG